MTKRVLMLAQRVSAGGVGEHIRVLGEELIRDGWEVYLAANWSSPNGSVEPSTFEGVGITPVHIPFPELSKPGVSALRDMGRAARELRLLVKSLKPVVMHVHWRTVLPYLVWLRHYVPVVFTLHNVNVSGFGTSMLYRVPHAFVSISADVLVDLVSRHQVSARKVTTVPHGVVVPHGRRPDPSTRQRARQLLGLSDKAFVVVSVGRLERVKRHDLTIEAVAALAAEGTDVVLMLVGDGTLRQSLEEQVQDCGLQGRVVLVGHQDPKSYLEASDTFVLASEYEGFALAVVEAMMFGVVPVRTPGGGANEQIQEGDTGFTFPFGDVDALTDRLRCLAADPVMKDKMAAAAAERARISFSAAEMSRATVAVYSRCQQVR